MGWLRKSKVGEAPITCESKSPRSVVTPSPVLVPVPPALRDPCAVVPIQSMDAKGLRRAPGLRTARRPLRPPPPVRPYLTPPSHHSAPASREPSLPVAAEPHQFLELLHATCQPIHQLRLQDCVPTAHTATAHDRKK